ncbi:O-antigen ligase family protein [Afipia sp. TerB]
MWSLLRATVFGILLVRASSDPIFNLLNGDSSASSMGLGAIFNVLGIAIAFILLVQWPLTAPLLVVGVWGPFLLIAFAATLYAADFADAARMALVLLSYWAFFAIPFFILRSSADVSRFVLLVIGSSIVPSLYALVDIAQGIFDGDGFRLQSTFSHPNIYAFYLVLLLGLLLYIRSSRIVRVTPRIRMLMMLYLPILLALLMLTKTRSAWITCGLMFLVYAIRIDRRFLAGLLLVPVLVAANPSLMERLTDITTATEIDNFSQLNADTRLNSYVWRQVLWESTIPQIVEKPLLGHGLMSFKRSTPSFFPLIGPEGIDGHNFYLQVGFEMGLLGVLALFWLLGFVALYLLRGLRRDRAGIEIMLCVLAAYALESFSDNMQFYLSFNWYFWFVMGTICAWIYNEETAVPATSAVTRRERHPGR